MYNISIKLQNKQLRKQGMLRNTWITIYSFNAFTNVHINQTKKFTKAFEPLNSIYKINFHTCKCWILYLYLGLRYAFGLLYECTVMHDDRKYRIYQSRNLHSKGSAGQRLLVYCDLLATRLRLINVFYTNRIALVEISFVSYIHQTT